MPGIINPFLGVVATGGVANPWDEVDRQTTISGGVLTLSGLSLTGCMFIRVIATGIKVTTDDSSVRMTLIIAGSEITTGSYGWGMERIASGVTASSFNAGTDTAVQFTSPVATQGVGNDTTESFNAEINIPHPTSALQKTMFYRSAWLNPGNNVVEAAYGTGWLANTGAITGVVLKGSSNLTAGSIHVLGVS